jgi:hypothetical protein
MSTRDDDKLLDDLLASVAGHAIADAFAGTKKAALAAGVDTRTARRWRAGENNPVSRVCDLVEKADNPWTIVVHIASVAVLRELQKDGPLTEWKWRAELIAACEREQPADGHEDTVTQKVLVGHATLADHLGAVMALLAPTSRIAALLLIGQRKNWSVAGPRAH